MKRALAWLLATMALAGVARAQSSPGWPQDYLPGPGEVNGAFAAKQDTVGVIPGSTTPFNFASVLARHRSIDDFSPHADCATDDLPAFATAFARLVLDGSGDLEVGPHCYAINSGNLTVPSKVRLIGRWYPGSQSYSSLFGAPYTLMLNPAFSLVPSSNSALSGLILARQGLTLPTSARAAASMVSAFSGTAIAMPSGGALDVDIRDTVVFGFNYPFDNPSGAPIERVTIRGMIGDNTNGPRINQSHDISRIDGSHFWPFLTANFSWSNDLTAAIASVTNVGGAVGIATAAAHGFLTGDVINVHDVAGVPAANGRFTVTVTSPTTFTLNGTTFAGAFTTSPSAAAKLDLLRRTGVGFTVLNSETTTISNSYAYDYSTQFHMGTGAGWTQLIGDSADSEFFLKDPNTQGLLVDDTAYGTTMAGGSINGQGVAVTLNSTATTGTTISGATINPGASPNPFGIQVLQGRATLNGNQSSGALPSQILVADAAASVVLNGNDMPAYTVSGSQAALNDVTGFGNVFGAGNPLFGSVVASNVTAGQFVNSYTPAGFVATGVDAGSAAPVTKQRIYVATVASGTGISVNGLSVGADAVVFNGGANPLKVYINQGVGTIAGSPYATVAAGQVLRISQVNANAWVPW